jgi:hypothetical protein
MWGLLLFFLSNTIVIRGSGQQLRDTSLLTLHARPFFYNVVKAGNGDIYAGTSAGIYRMRESELERIDGQKGYLKIDRQGKPVIDPDGIRNHQSPEMTHLLPYPTLKRDLYLSGNDRNLYITSAGTMYVYEILPYGRAFKNHSIRTISSNFTGTYSGIYYRNRSLEEPVSSFTDGYIREYNGSVFMCTHGLDVFDMKSIETGTKPELQKLPPDFDFLPCRDIYYIESARNYLVASGNRLGIMDSGLQVARKVFQGKEGEETVLLNELKPYGSVFFSSGPRLYLYSSTNDRTDSLTTLAEPILDGIVKTRMQLLLTANGLYIQQGEKPFEKKLPLSKAHTIRSLNDQEYAIGTDEGLFHYDVNGNKLSTLIPGVEFNRRALFVEGSKLYAGTVNGLYIFDLSNLDKVIDFHDDTLNRKRTERIPLWFTAAFIVMVSGLLFLNLRNRRQLQVMKEALDNIPQAATKAKLSREDIESFIRENLPTASLKSIISHFDTNNSMVYSVLAPEKPGDLIQKLRYEKVRNLSEEGKPVEEITAATGLSDSYIRKIRRRKDPDEL